ncbi:MAG: hypothetical protein JKP90_23085 [Desulfofustis sp. PB-SRB1]|nr:hypothetical protein [Desulfofustis sp. PB-SRB1]
MAIQTVLGAAEMLARTDEHPALLRDRVCSPGGTTICAQHALERGRFHSVVMDAVEAPGAVPKNSPAGSALSVKVPTWTHYHRKVSR